MIVIIFFFFLYVYIVFDRLIIDVECDTIFENLGRDYKKFSRKMGFKEV